MSIRISKIIYISCYFFISLCYVTGRPQKQVDRLGHFIFSLMFFFKFQNILRLNPATLERPPADISFAVMYLPNSRHFSARGLELTSELSASVKR